MKLFLSLCLVFSMSSFAQDKKITIVGDAWCPYNCETTGDMQGFVVDLAKEIFKKKGIEVEYKIVTWARALKDTGANKFHAAIGANQEEMDKNKLIGKDNIIANVSDSFFVKKGNPWRYDSKDMAGSLKKLTGAIGIIADYEYEYAEHLAGLKQEKVTGDDAGERLITMLMKDRIQTVSNNPYVFAWTFKSLRDAKKLADTDAFEVAGSIGEPDPAKLAFGPKFTEHAETFKAGLEELKKNGKYKEIMRKYGLE